MANWFTRDGTIIREKSIPVKHQTWRVSEQAVMQDQWVAWSKLNCLKPIFLALISGVSET